MIPGISDRAVFSRLWSDGHHVRTRDLRLRYLPEGDSGDQPHVAYSISRKVGKAVVRNKLRRRLRAAIGEYVEATGAPFIAAVVIVSPTARDLPYQDVKMQVQELMQKAEKSRMSPR